MRLFSTALLAAALFCAQASALTTYTQTISSSTTQVVIPESTHGINSPHLGVEYYDASGTRQATSLFSWSVDSVSYAVTVTFSPSVSSGHLALVGPFSSTTAASTDFLVSTSGLNMYVCSMCGSTSPAVRNAANGLSYAMYRTYTLTGTGTTSATTVYAYIDSNGRPTFGVTTSAALLGFSCSQSTDCFIALTPTGYPSGSIHLGHATFNSGGSGVFGTVSDDRPTEFK